MNNFVAYRATVALRAALQLNIVNWIRNQRHCSQKLEITSAKMAMAGRRMVGKASRQALGPLAAINSQTLQTSLDDFLRGLSPPPGTGTSECVDAATNSQTLQTSLDDLLRGLVTMAGDISEHRENHYLNSYFSCGSIFEHRDITLFKYLFSYFKYANLPLTQTVPTCIFCDLHPPSGRLLNVRHLV